LVISAGKLRIKKYANEELFIKIQEEFEEALEEDSAEYRFTIDHLRTKY
jgi:DNA-binding MltR family transcriptional regulator